MIYTIKNNLLTAQFNSKGAELIVLNTNKRNYIWDIDLNFWNKTSPILFPIVGKLKNESYFYNNQQYLLPRHGFARIFEFDVIEKSETNIVFSLKSNDQTKQNYPFDFELQIAYTLENNQLHTDYKIINLDEVVLPYNIGAHPAFALQQEFENYHLEFQTQENLTSYQLENEILTAKTSTLLLENKKLPLSYSLFEIDALVFKTILSKNITIFENENPILKVHFDDFKNLGIWTKNNAKFICIEPWNGYADTQNANGVLLDKENINLLKPNSFDIFRMSIEIL